MVKRGQTASATSARSFRLPSGVPHETPVPPSSRSPLSRSPCPRSRKPNGTCPTAYPANNFHTENIQQFASDVDKATGGKLKITVHPNASLFKAPEIKRAVQGGQAQVGEILLVNFENEDPLYGLDGIPFLATSYGDAAQALQGVAQDARRAVREAGDEAPLHGAVAAAGNLHEAHAQFGVADMKGLKWRAYSPATSKIAELVGAQPVTVQAAEVSQALATGVIDSIHVVRRDRLRLEDLRAHQELLRHAGVAAEERRHRQPEGIRRARQADAGRGAEGGRRRRDARLEALRGEDTAGTSTS